MTVNRPEDHWQDNQPAASLDGRQLVAYAALVVAGAALGMAGWLANLSWVLVAVGVFLLLTGVLGAVLLAVSRRLPRALDRRFRVVRNGDDEQAPAPTPWDLDALATALAARLSEEHVVSASSNAIRVDVLDPGGSASGQGVLLFATRPGAFRLNWIRQGVDWAQETPTAVTPLALVASGWQGKGGKARPAPSVASSTDRPAPEPTAAGTPRRGLVADEADEAPAALVDTESRPARRRVLEEPEDAELPGTAVEASAVEPDPDSELPAVLAATLQDAGWRVPALADPETRVTVVVVVTSLLIAAAAGGWLLLR